MGSGKMDEVRATDFKPDEFKALPDAVQEELDKHRQQYLTDPENAHYWNPIAIGTPGGPVATLLLHHVGRKSGRDLNTALQYYNLDGKVAIVASRGGTEGHPAWYLNLLDKPECKVQISKNSYDCVARTMDDEERAQWWDHITEEQPAQAEYQARTTRKIPVVILEGAVPFDGKG